MTQKSLRSHRNCLVFGRKVHLLINTIPQNCQLLGILIKRGTNSSNLSNWSINFCYFNKRFVFSCDSVGKLIAHPWFKRNSASFLSVRQRCFTGSLIKWHPKNTCRQRRDVGLLGRI